MKDGTDSMCPLNFPARSPIILPLRGKAFMTHTLWKYRKFIWSNALAELRHRFAGSIAGWLWNIFAPLAQLVVFAVIFSALMGYENPEPFGPKGKYSFIIFLCSGLLAWNAFADALVRSTAGLIGNASYLKKLPLPEQIFIAQEATGGFVTSIISIVLFLLFSIFIAGYGPFWQWIQVVAVLFLFMWFAYGLGLILACMNVFFRDILPLMNVVMLLWMWLTPIVYPATKFGDPQHRWMLTLFECNPAYHFISAFHDCLFRSVWIDGRRWMTIALIALGINLIAPIVLRRFRSDIRDVL